MKTDAHTIIDFIKMNKTMDLCNLYELKASGSESILDCHNAFNTLVGNLVFDETLTIDNEPKHSLICGQAWGSDDSFKNSYYHHRDTTHAHYYRNKVNKIIGGHKYNMGWVTNYAEIEICSRIYVDNPLNPTFVGDPEFKPIVPHVNWIVNNIPILDYPWNPESPPIDCVDHFNNDHLLTQHLIVANYMLHSRHLIGEMLFNW